MANWNGIISCKVKHPLCKNRKYPVAIVLRDLAPYSCVAGEHENLMMEAAKYIDDLEKIIKRMATEWKYNYTGEVKWV